MSRITFFRPAIAVIILNWNNASATIRCAESVLGASDTARESLESMALYVVDNGSEPPDRAKLIDWCNAQKGNVHFVRNAENLGFARGMNAGFDRARLENPDFLWLLNNDIQVEQNAISALLRFSKANRSAVVVGATVLDAATRKVQAAGGYRYYPWLGLNRPLLAGLSKAELDRAQSVAPDYIDGAAMWLEGAFIQRNNGLPVEHFLYFEELELNQWLTEEESIAWCREAVVYHEGGGSITTPAQMERSTYHAAFSAFDYTRNYCPWYLPTVVTARILGISIRALFRRQPGLLIAVFRALRNFMTGRTYPES